MYIHRRDVIVLAGNAEVTRVVLEHYGCSVTTQCVTRIQGKLGSGER